MDIVSKNTDIDISKDWKVCDSLLNDGKFDQFRKAFLMGYPVTEWVFDDAMKMGSLETVRLMIIHGINGKTMTVFDGKLPCPLGMSMISTDVHDAASHGHLHICKWIHEMGLYASENFFMFMHGGAAGGQLDVLKWARSIGLPWECYDSPNFGYVENVCETAARFGHFDVVKWAYESGCPLWGKDVLTVCASAALQKNIEMVKWARERGCPWGPRMFEYKEVPELLEWARNNIEGCPW